MKNYMEVTQILQPYIENEKVQDMQNYIQHGTVTTLEHCITVATMSYFIVKLFGLKVNLSVLLVGALLHDFYLYDWHNKSFTKRLPYAHGIIHPIVARKNAQKQFDIDDKTANVIESHMFPINITKVPKYKESIIVGLADKIVSLKETVIGFVIKFERLCKKKN